MKPLTDAELAALTPTQRRVIRLMAKGGWASGTPGMTDVESVGELTGLWYDSEQWRGEPRAFWPLHGDEPRWQALADRLDALPRRPRGTARASTKTVAAPKVEERHEATPPDAEQPSGFRAFCNDPVCRWIAAESHDDEEDAWADLRAHMDAEHWSMTGVRKED